MNNVTNSIFLFSVKNRERIITTFKIAYLLLFLLTLVGCIIVFKKLPYRIAFIELAEKMGQFAIIVYILTIIPGIVRRFGKHYKITSVLMVYRRYVGILLFCMVLYHYMIERGISLFFLGIQQYITGIVQYQIFELFGMAAFFCIFLLTVTSNDISTKRLGVWWGRIHNLTYVLIWLIFVHAAMQAVNVWSLLIGMVGLIQVSSIVYRFRKLSSRTPIRDLETP